MEDIHIINLFLERSEDAIRQVEVKYEKFCFKIAWNILYNTEDSEECVNDTWLITWNKIPPKTPTKLSAFLGKITRNLALDNFRKKNASKRADTHMMDICGEVEKLENTIKDYVEEDIKKKEILNILEKFLSDLKAGDRDIFVRRYWYMDNIKDIPCPRTCPGKDDAFTGDLYVQWGTKGSVLEKDETDSWRERPVFNQYQLYL